MVYVKVAWTASAKAQHYAGADRNTTHADHSYAATKRKS